MENAAEIYSERVMDTFEKELAQNNDIIPACKKHLRTARRGAWGSVGWCAGNVAAMALCGWIMGAMCRGIVKEGDYIYNVYAIVVCMLMCLSACGAVKHGKKGIGRVKNAKKLEKRFNDYVKNRDFARLRIKEMQGNYNGRD